MIVDDWGDTTEVSIRAALTGGDLADTLASAQSLCFNPRRPHGRRLLTETVSFSPESVSIRAALTGGDSRSMPPGKAESCFNPRRPHGRRLVDECDETPEEMFQSAPPSRAATAAPMAATTSATCFNPRRPHGRRPLPPPLLKQSATFQSAPPSRAATILVSEAIGKVRVSIRAALTGGDSVLAMHAPRRGGFNPRRPHGRRLPVASGGR